MIATIMCKYLDSFLANLLLIFINSRFNAAGSLR